MSVFARNKRTEYSYRPDSLRHSKKTGQSRRTHLWDGQNIVAEVSASGNVVDRFIRGINLLARQQDGSREYYLHDAHGDVTQRVSNLGVLRTYRYDAFGNEKDAVAEDSNPFRYCEEYWDSESGDVYLRARYYDPSTGRFSSEDSVRSTSFKMPNGQEAEDPLSLNLYAYCKNSPIIFLDSGGDFALLVAVGIGISLLAAISLTAAVVSVISQPSIGSNAAMPQIPSIEDIGLRATLTLVIAALVIREEAQELFDETKQAVDDAIKQTGEAIDLVKSKIEEEAENIISKAEKSKGAEHKKKGTTNPANKNKHQEGQTRKKRDQGNEKGDDRRIRPRDYKIPKNKKKKGT